jgi:hypothetical protein
LHIAAFAVRECQGPKHTACRFLLGDRPALILHFAAVKPHGLMLDCRTLSVKRSQERAAIRVVAR